MNRLELENVIVDCYVSQQINPEDITDCTTASIVHIRKDGTFLADDGDIWNYAWPVDQPLQEFKPTEDNVCYISNIDYSNSLKDVAKCPVSPVLKCGTEDFPYISKDGMTWKHAWLKSEVDVRLENLKDHQK